MSKGKTKGKPPGPEAKTQRSYVRTRITRATGFIATALVSVLIGVVFGPTVSDYLAIGQPDIRYTYNQLPENERFRILDQFIDANGNSVFFTSIRLRVKNVAFKQGHIDKAEFVPFTVQTLPKIDVISVEKRSICWREELVVEVRALMTATVGVTGPTSERRSIELEVRLFDNTGRQVGRFVDGLLARMRMKAADDFTRTLVPPVVRP